MRRALRALIERSGFGVVDVASGSAALAYLAEGGYADAVVSDVLMPEISGVTFYDRLLEVAPALSRRVVFLTGAARDPRVHLPIEQRGVPLISKMDDLLLVVDALRIALLRRSSEPPLTRSAGLTAGT